MPTWFIFAIAMSLTYSVINHIDHSLLSRYFKEGGVEVLLVFSALFSCFGIPYAIYMEPDVLTIEWKNMLIMLLAAGLNTTLLYCYLKAMTTDEPTVVVLYYQLVPVIALILGYFILEEVISKVEFIAMIIVITGTTLASFKKTDLQQITFRWRTAGLMLIATTCWATETTIGKIVILDESVYHSVFWESILMVGVGICILIFKPQYRKSFQHSWKVNSGVILSVMVLSEALYAAGNTLSAKATELKEVSIVMLLQPTQTIFVFIIGIGLALLFPTIYTEKLTQFDLFQKIAAIAITTYGSYLLLM